MVIPPLLPTPWGVFYLLKLQRERVSLKRREGVAQKSCTAIDQNLHFQLAKTTIFDIHPFL